MTSDDDDVWALYAKSVKKMRKAKASAKNTSSPRKRETNVTHLRDKTPHTLPAQHDRIPVSTGMTKNDPSHITLDRRVEKDLRAGDIEIEARIDLHGMTQPVAFNALARFMATQVKASRRNLLIITGKGKGSEGVLRTNLPHWLQTLPEAAHILTIRPSAPKHGGDGAFYVLMRKKKPTNKALSDNV